MPIRYLKYRDLANDSVEYLSAAAVVNDTPALRRYRARIAGLKLGGKKVGDAAAQDFVERFVVALFRTATHDLEARIGPHARAISELRDEISARYERIVAHFETTSQGKLGSGLRHDDLEPLLRRLDRHMDALEREVMRSDLETRSRSESMTAEHLEQADDVPPEVEPTVKFDEEISDRPPAHPDEEHRRRLGEEKALVPEDLDKRAEIQRAANALISSSDDPKDRRLFPSGTRIGVVRRRVESQGIEAQLTRFVGRDTTFLAEGYELEINLGGRVFGVDGIEFLSPDRKTYRFLESKETYAVKPEGQRFGYATEAGREDLAIRIKNDLEVAEALREFGCQGFSYGVDPTLRDFFEGEIARLGAGSLLSMEPE